MGTKAIMPCYTLQYYREEVAKRIKIGKQFDLLVYGSDDVGGKRTFAKAVPLEMHDTYWRLSVTHKGRKFIRCALFVDLWDALVNGNPMYV